MEQIVDALNTVPDWAYNLIKAAVVIVVTWVANRVLHRLEGRVVGRLERDAEAVDEEDIERRKTIAGVLGAVTTFVVWTLGLLLALGQAGVNIAPLIAAAGIGGVAIGFGAQNLVRDMLAGFFILLEDQYHIGDVIEVAGVSGTVEKIGIRSTVLRDLRGRVHTVPNGEITVTSNYTDQFSRYLIDLPIPYEEDVDRVVDVVNGVVETMRTDPEYAEVITDFKVLGVQDYSASEVLVRMYVETLPGRHWPVGRELRRRIKTAYDAAGIPIPYPHREIIIKTSDPAPTPDPEG